MKYAKGRLFLLAEKEAVMNCHIASIALASKRWELIAIYKAAKSSLGDCIELTKVVDACKEKQAEIDGAADYASN